jgi:hypothetical protein
LSAFARANTDGWCLEVVVVFRTTSGAVARERSME